MSVAAADAVETLVIGLLAAKAPPGRALGRDSVILADAALDSVGVMDFVMEVEDALDLSIPLERLAGVATVGDFIDVLRDIKAAGQ